MVDVVAMSQRYTFTKARVPRALSCGALLVARAALLLASAAFFGCKSLPPKPAYEYSVPESAGERSFQPRQLPAADGLTLTALERPARASPARYRVIVIPGSGCAGMAPFADRYFAGLLHAQVLVLHKPWVDPQASTSANRCSVAFVEADALAAWRDHAIAALRADARGRANEPSPLPTLMVGISEGAELLPFLAPEVPHLAGMVLIGSSGLDPQDALTLQAERQGASAHLNALEQAQASTLPDAAVREGRSLRYWRDLSQWSLAQPLLAGPWPMLQVWGEEDALVPQAAYQRFMRHAEHRAAPYCTLSLPGADHGLQRPGHDGAQTAWWWLEQWAREPHKGLCAKPAASH